jgi:hypothetical protein
LHEFEQDWIKQRREEKRREKRREGKRRYLIFRFLDRREEKIFYVEC